MYQVLHIMGDADVGGMSTVVLNYYKYIDRHKIHFDIALTGVQPGRNGKKLEELGSNIYCIPMKSDGLKEYKKALRKLLETKKYDAVHVHENETSYVALGIAKKAGVKKRIAHSHTSAPTYNFKQEMRRLSGCILNYFYATDLVACGQLAGERVFGKKMRSRKACVLPNAVETDRFLYNADVRKKMRGKLGVENNYVIGMVGRLSEEKNHGFALKIMREVHLKMDEAILILLGDGEERGWIENEIKMNDMEEYVKLAGSRNDVSDFYQAFDMCILPSVHEGFPMVAVEALAAGLPLLLSDTVTDEFKFSSAVKYLPVSSADIWVKELLDVGYSNDDIRRLRGWEVVKNGYDVQGTAGKLESIYLS